ncbi:FUSC family protein [Micromonospora purpureochromogenes]|uniref:FUSC family protein n=1 Tax=Micromonospora purpureochromogenes TaxID=47872 RepID=UPI00340957B0
MAAWLGWFISAKVLDSAEPLFAPAVAVGVIAGAIGNRVRRTGELVAGVVLGAFIGHWLVRAIGVGPVQTGLVVILAISATILFRGGGAVMAQAGGTALLLGLVTGGPNLAVPRTQGVLVGGLVAITVALLILPINPLRVVRRAASPTADLFASELTTLGRALTHRDLKQAEDALNRATAAEAHRKKVTEMVAAAREVAILSPWRRRRLGMIRRYQHASEHIDNIYASGREMARWTVAAIREDEPLPAGLSASIEHFGQAVRLLYRDFLAEREPEPTRARALQAIKDADDACAEGLEISGTAVVAQLRASVSELLQATGLPEAEANEQAGLTHPV